MQRFTNKYFATEMIDEKMNEGRKSQNSKLLRPEIQLQNKMHCEYGQIDTNKGTNNDDRLGS